MFNTHKEKKKNLKTKSLYVMQLLQARCIAAQAQNYVDFYFELLLKMNITKKTYSDLWITESGRRKRIETGKDFGESKSG